MTDTIKISRSMIGDFLRCRKKYEYNHIQELGETGVSIPMRAGTLGHAGLAAGYEAFGATQKLGIVLGPDTARDLFVNSAMGAMAKLIKDGSYLYRGEPQTLGLVPGVHDDVIRTIGDSVNFYADKFAYADFMQYEVVAVEKEFTWNFVIEIPSQDGHSLPTVVAAELSGIMDLCARDHSFTKIKMLSVFDHKFVGDVNGSLAFLPMDVQMLVYEIIVWYVATQTMGYDDVELQYNMVRREVPPGYGSRPATTKSGARSTASIRPEDYLRRTTLYHSDNERAAIESNFLRPSLKELVTTQTQGGPWLVTPIKTGGESCVTGCSFFARCGAALVGAGQPKIGAPSAA